MAVTRLVRNSAEDVSEQEPGGSWIQYSPDLIAELINEHAALIRDFSALGELVIADCYTAIVPALENFSRAFEAHLLDENLRFYCYLEQRLAGSREELRQVQHGRADLSAVAREVSAFLRKYRNVGVRYANRKMFLDELHGIGALLVHRVDREEKYLFPLYRA